MSGGPPEASRPSLPLTWRLVAWPIASIAWLTVRLLAATWRYEVATGAPAALELARRGGPVLLCGWHQSLLPLSAWLLNGPLRVGHVPTFLVSRSRDGELVSRLLRLWGARTVRGSSSRGGAEGLRALHRAIRKERASVVTLADGPRGPERQFKPGTLVLAQVNAAPLIPLACLASSAWQLGSWDRLLVPKPFARIRIALGPPVEVDRELDEAGRATLAVAMAELLNGLERDLRAAAAR